MFNRYEEIKQWRGEMIECVAKNHFDLNSFHDQLIHHTFHLAKVNIESEQGPPPAPFAFFLMGSAGRFEQSLWSDQDHGIVFEGEQEDQNYFLKLGEEIREGLAIVGYERCEGNVMASNPLWCQSVELLQTQMAEWLKRAEWQTLRHFQIFFDSRVLAGEKDLLMQVKKAVFEVLDGDPALYGRLFDNMNYVKKGVGVFGQLLSEFSGDKKGYFNLKQTAYFPYVNALRMLALFQKVNAPSTLSRFQALAPVYPVIAGYENDFRLLLQQRLDLRKDAQSYDNVHLLSLRDITKKEKHELKMRIKRGQQLYSITKSIIKEEGRS